MVKNTRNGYRSNDWVRSFLECITLWDQEEALAVPVRIDAGLWIFEQIVLDRQL